MFSFPISAPIAATASGVFLLVFPRPLGGGIGLNIQNVEVHTDGDTGELHIDGENSGIRVVPLGASEGGPPTGFGPASPADAAALSEILGTPISVGDSIEEAVNNGVNGSEDSEETNPPDIADGVPSTGQVELDGVLEGTIATDDGTFGLETPISKEEFENQISSIPGVQVITHGAPGIEVKFPDGTTISTYPARASSQSNAPGYQITSPDGTTTHKGSLVGD